MRDVVFDEAVRVALLDAALEGGYSRDVIEGLLISIAHDIGRTFDGLILRPPDHPDRRTYLRRVEALGLIQAVCEEQAEHVVVVALDVEVFADEP